MELHGNICNQVDGFDVNVDDRSRGTVSSTPIQQFYKNRSIFVTGGTGFLGKVLIEKLLRGCPGVSRIFVLVREKKGKTVDERMRELLDNSVFDAHRRDARKLQKLRGIAGDCQRRNLGIADDDMDLLKEQVSVVFHVAATVRFDENLSAAFATNVRSTSNVVDLCKNMKNLKSFVHVSTLYANCFAANVQEAFHDYSIGHKQLQLLIDGLPEKLIDAITPQLIKPWPNTYTFSKALAEDLVRETCAQLPVGIFRPGIVSPSACEPTPGWIDNYTGFAGVVASVAGGLMRVGYCDPRSLVNVVPVDLTVNAIIACAWATATRTDRGENILIYNFTSTNDAPIAWNQVKKYMVKYINEYPSMNTLWCAIFQLTKRHWLYNLYIFLLHLMPAYCIDVAIRAIGQKSRLLTAYDKLHTMVDLVYYFSTNIWLYKDENVHDLWDQLDPRDQQIFQFSMLNFDWENYIANCIKGVRVFLFKDDLITLEQSRIKYKRFLWIHQIMVASLIGFMCWVLYKVILILF
ncbi:putative fatty acyl-CoA reductase CG5065 [Phymastichus coffea]|uniref:putative fatty acyl-CoA reductase CG5065 n=1 Tax=Phymastichus coffea TaxID=108790 RepID=UPI00273C1B2A|nr:putative fatty acyl-CoA reductase CG5065 [Phymastichus coffea]